jgi:4-hydroxyphenylpyruvate dioxygenase-like putative hemolysin
VDRAFHDLKSGTAEPVPAPTAQFAVPPTAGEEALKVADALDALADALSEDAAVVRNHGSKLQSLDIASQLLRRSAAVKS